MTYNEYSSKGLCYLCAYGEKVHEHVVKISAGMFCEPEKQKLVTLNSLLNIYLGFDTRDLPDFPEEFNPISAEEFEELMIKIESLL